MIEPYRTRHFAAIRAFARLQPEFEYLKAIVRVHTRGKLPGGVWVWREGGRIVAVCGMAYPNSRDAWLYGMRVDPAHQGRGVATRFTQGLCQVAAQTGHSWIGLDTMNRQQKAPVFRIAEKLGMKLEGVFATSCLWNPRSLLALVQRQHRPRKVPAEQAGARSPKLRRQAWLGWPPYDGILDHWRSLGITVMLHQYYRLWIWSRIGTDNSRCAGISDQLSAFTVGSVLRAAGQGYLVLNTPVHVAHDLTSTGSSTLCINVFDRPARLGTFLNALLSFAAGEKCRLVVNHPASWLPAMRRRVRSIRPDPSAGDGFFAAWRVYGLKLR